MFQRTAAAVLLTLLVLPAPAFAFTGQGRQAIQRWVASDRCAQAARKAFPDYTDEANAKRDAQMRQCLAAGNLPPRPSLAPPGKP